MKIARTTYILTILCTLAILAFTLETINAKVIGYTFSQQCKKATEIFIGKVINIEETKLDSNWTTRTIAKVVRLHSWKGQVNDTMTYIYTNSMACCGSRWLNNEIFLIYTTNNKVDFCSGRTRLAKENKDILKLNVKYNQNRFRRQ